LIIIREFFFFVSILPLYNTNGWISRGLSVAIERDLIGFHYLLCCGTGNFAFTLLSSLGGQSYLSTTPAVCGEKEGGKRR
jgi:hypothetical protein